MSHIIIAQLSTYFRLNKVLSWPLCLSVLPLNYYISFFNVPGILKWTMMNTNNGPMFSSLTNQCVEIQYSSLERFPVFLIMFIIPNPWLLSHIEYLHTAFSLLSGTQTWQGPLISEFNEARNRAVVSMSLTECQRVIKMNLLVSVQPQMTVATCHPLP